MQPPWHHRTDSDRRPPAQRPAGGGSRAGPRLTQAARALAGGSLPGVVVWAFPRFAAIVTLSLMVVLSAAHPALVLYRTWARLEGWRGRMARVRLAVRPVDTHGRSILRVGGVSTVLVTAVLVVYSMSVGVVGVLACLGVNAIFVVSFVHGSGRARRSGSTGYQLRHTVIGAEIADLTQATIAFCIKDAARAGELMQEWFGLCIDEGKDHGESVTVRRSGRQALVVVLIAGLGVAAGAAGALVGQARESGGDEAVVPGPPRVDNPTVATLPDAGRVGPGAYPAPSPIWASELCHGDPTEILRAVFGESRSHLASAVASVLGPRGYDTTGCPGPGVVQVGALLVVPLRSVLGRQPSYVVVDRRGKATVIDPDAFAVLGQPDSTVAAGFRGGALSEPLVVSVEGPYANAPRPGSDTPASQLDDRKAYLIILRHEDGSCAAAVRTEPQKNFVFLPPAVAALAQDFAVDYGFILVTHAGPSYSVQAYHAREGFVQATTILYAVPVATVAVTDGSPAASTNDGDPCRVDGMRTSRYPFQ